MRELKNLFDTNWCDEFQDGDVVTRKEGDETIEVILLAGLQRMAREAGIVRQACAIQTPSATMVQAIFEATFFLQEENREVTFVGTADCNTKNTQGRFAHYPTAVAESRAEARCLRKALGIRMLSSEEIGFREGAGSLEASPNAKVAGSLIAAIEKLCETRGIDAVTALDAVLDADRASNIHELAELRTDEAQAVMGWLNDQKPASKTNSSKRAARKAELEGKVNG